MVRQVGVGCPGGHLVRLKGILGDEGREATSQTEAALQPRGGGCKASRIFTAFVKQGGSRRCIWALLDRGNVTAVYIYHDGITGGTWEQEQEQE